MDEFFLLSQGDLIHGNQRHPTPTRTYRCACVWSPRCCMVMKPAVSCDVFSLNIAVTSWKSDLPPVRMQGLKIAAAETAAVPWKRH